MADALVVPVYRFTQSFPSEERYGLQALLRRAAVSTAANIVEGAARLGHAEYVHFLTIAVGSAAEAQYLIELSGRLGFAQGGDQCVLITQYDDLLRSLKALISGLGR